MSYGAAPGQFPYETGHPRGQTPSYGSGVGRSGMGGFGMGRRGMRGGGARAMGGSFAQRNQASLMATTFAAIYVLLAVTTHFVLLGIAPAFMCFRAFQRRETLAPLALVAAIVAIGIAVAFYSGR